MPSQRKGKTNKKEYHRGSGGCQEGMRAGGVIKLNEEGEEKGGRGWVQKNACSERLSFEGCKGGRRQRQFGLGKGGTRGCEKRGLERRKV